MGKGSPLPDDMTEEQKKQRQKDLQKLWRQNNREHQLEAVRAWHKKNRAHVEAHKDKTARHKVKARKASRDAVKAGKLVKTPCVVCGFPEVEGHHTDYSKPLVVVWLCRPCHAAEHVRLNACIVNEEKTDPLGLFD